MRKALLLVASIPLIVAPPASAADHPAGDDVESVCATPDMRVDYDVETINVHAVLPATGCAAREHRQFQMTARVTRHNGDDSRDVAEWYEQCGPFRSPADFDDPNTAPRYQCVLDMGVFHPTREDRIHYDVALTYPGAVVERTETTTMVCSSHGEETTCDQ